MKAEVANQLKIALVQAAGLTEGSPLVVFEVSSSDKILHRWRSQERKKTPHPVWHQQWAVSLDANVAAPSLKARLEDVSRGELMGHALINLTSLLDRKIHRGWHKLVGEATDVNETVTVELGGEVELIVQWCHSPAKVAEVVPPTTPKPAKPSPSGISAGISGSTQKKVFFGVAAAGMAAAAGARARRRAAARAVPELAEIEKDAAPAVTTEEDDDEASLDLVEDYTYVNPFDVHRFWNREVFVTPPGAVPRPFFSQLPRRRRRDGVESVSRAQASSARGGSCGACAWRPRSRRASPSCCTACPRRSSRPFLI